MSKIITEVTLVLVNVAVAATRKVVALHVKALQHDTNQAIRRERKESEALAQLDAAVQEQKERYADAVHDGYEVQETNALRISAAQGRVK